MNGIKFWSYNAGHVLGAAMFMIEIAGVKILYTGIHHQDTGWARNMEPLEEIWNQEGFEMIS